MRLVADLELDGVTGKYFDRQRESQAHRQAYDADARRRLANSAPSCWWLNQRRDRNQVAEHALAASSGPAPGPVTITSPTGSARQTTAFSRRDAGKRVVAGKTGELDSP